MHNNLLLSYVLSLLFFAGSGLSQEWGEISDDMLQMTNFESDPEADAIVIFDIGDVEITPDFYLRSDQHKRLKILTEEGKDRANIKIPYYYENEIVDIEAICYHPNGDEFEIDSDEIYDEGSGKWKQKVFAIPGVEVGCIIEYSYRLISKYIHRLEPWVFQNDDYTLLSKLSAKIPAGFNYGALKMHLNDHDLETKRDEVFAIGTGGSEKIAQYTWTMRNIPAIRKEPYMTAFKDYYAQILFQVISYHRRTVHLDFAKEWNDIAETVSNRYDPLFSQDNGIVDFVENLLKDVKDPVIRAEKLYNFVRTAIKSSKYNGLIGADLKEPEDVFETRSGSSNERNLLLINMLRQAGLDANPLVISTRNNGKIFPGWVQLQQFNRTIVHLKIGKKTLFLDTTNNYCPFGYLTPSSDVEQGLLVRGDEGKIIVLKPNIFKSKTKISTEAQVLDQGELAASTEFTYEGYDAVRMRNQLNDSDVKEYLTEKLEDLFQDAILDTFCCFDMDSVDKPLKVTVNYHLPAYIQAVEHLQYFSPPYFTSVSKNPFVRQTRNFPIDFPYTYAESEVVKIKLPSGLLLSEVPKKCKKSIKEVSFNKIYFTNDKGIECRRSFNIRKKRVSQSKYADLKLTFDDIVESDQTQIVLTQQQQPN